MCRHEREKERTYSDSNNSQGRLKERNIARRTRKMRQILKEEKREDSHLIGEVNN